MKRPLVPFLFLSLLLIIASVNLATATHAVTVKAMDPPHRSMDVGTLQGSQSGSQRWRFGVDLGRNDARTFTGALAFDMVRIYHSGDAELQNVATWRINGQTIFRQQHIVVAPEQSPDTVSSDDRLNRFEVNGEMGPHEPRTYVRLDSERFGRTFTVELVWEWRLVVAKSGDVRFHTDLDFETLKTIDPPAPLCRSSTCAGIATGVAGVGWLASGAYLGVLRRRRPLEAVSEKEG